MAFALGVRHGFDLDHLATIDSITRTVKDNARLSKYVGFLFSFGHGVVVILMSFIIGSGIVQARSPVWLESFGQWISIFFLFAFGLLTLWNILPNTSIVPSNFRGFLFKKWLGEKYNPFLIILIGALFALSFDTFTQVTLLSISVSVMAGLFFTLVLGIVFMLGMMASDGFNGLFVSSLIHLADRRSAMVSRLIGLLIACFSLVLGLLGLLNKLATS